jgi:hypothetical protein
MKQRVSRYIGLLLLSLSVCAQPILIAPQNQPFAGSSLSNLRVLRQSPDGTLVILTVDFIYDGIHGPTARLLPVISDKKQPKISSWFGANPVTIGAGHGTTSLKVKFFNDDPGVPSELTTDHVRILMLSDGGNTILSQGIFSRTIKWGGPNAAIAPAAPPESHPLDEARLRAEQEQRISQELAKAEETERQVRLNAQAQAQAKAREEARLKAESDETERQKADAQRLAEEKAKAEAEAKARQEAEAKRLAEERARVEFEAKAREEARLKAAAQEKARQEAEAQRLADEKSKADADAKAREEARLTAEAEETARQIAVARQLAEEKAKAAAELKAREEARLTADAAEKARQEAEAQRLAVEAQEKARQEAEAQRLAEEKSKVEAEAKVREEARLKSEAEEKARQAAVARQLADQQAKAEVEAKARQDAETQRLAREKSKAEAEAKAREETRPLAEENARVATLAQTAPTPKPALAISSRTRTKVTNVDVVNRNLDRTEMTIAVEYQYAREDGPARMGVDLASTDDPGVSDYFSCPAMEIGKGSRNFVMFPVKLNVAAAQGVKRPTLPTDKVWVYLADASGNKSYIFQGTMLLVWHVPGPAAAPAQTGDGNTLEIESVKQNGLFSGYVTVNYNMRAPKGRLRLRIFDSANPATASWFVSDDIPIKSGPGLELVKIAVPRDAAAPDVFSADTVEIQMLDAKDAVLATLRKHLPMSWAKPK